MDRPVDVRELVAFSALLALCTLIPLPIIDRLIMNQVRRWQLRRLLAKRGVSMSPEDVATLADESGGGCAGCLLSVVIWPLKKIFRSVVAVFQLKEMMDVAFEQTNRIVMLDDAFDHGLRDAVKIRAAMDQADARVRIYPVERAIWGEFKQKEHPWVEAVTARAGVWRSHVPPDETPAAKLVSHGRVFSPTALAWFRQELGLNIGDPAVEGPVEPELLPADPSPPQITEVTPIADAEVVRREEPAEDLQTEEFPKGDPEA